MKDSSIRRSNGSPRCQPKSFGKPSEVRPSAGRNELGLRRNAAIAIGNSGRSDLIPIVEKLAADPEESVAEAARWASKRLKLDQKAPENEIAYLAMIFAMYSPFASPISSALR